MSAPKIKAKARTYRVWVAQVNQTMVEVRATNSETAAIKGYAKWRKEQAHSYVNYVALADQS